MQSILQYLDSLPYLMLGQANDKEDIIRLQKDLLQHNLPQLPEDFVKLLQHTNSINFNGTFIFGINSSGFSSDILAENLNLDLPCQNSTLILGYNNFEYLAYHQPSACYQIIDKDDLEVVETYNNLLEPLQYLLKA